MNINRDYLIINDVKKSNVTLGNGSMFFYITDKNTQNIFVNLVINVSKNDLIQKYANIENAEDYTLTMNIVKPDNTYKVVEGKLHDKENAIFEFNLNEDCCDEIGTYRCELLTKCNINDHEEITTSNKLTYKVKSSVLNDLDDIVEALEYPLVIQLFDKLSDINQYEEDRRANELARQLAEEQRQARFDVLDADMSNRIEIIDNKLVEIDNVLISKEDIAEIKAKNTEQDNRLNVAENRLANIGNDITNTMQPIIDGHTSRLDAIEAVNVAQNNRLEAIEVKNQQQDDRLLDIEKINNRQNIDIKCLYGASQTIDVAKEGNGIYLQNSNNGFAVVDEIKGNTLVNCNKEPNKELILNGNINTSADNNVTITEGVNGGLVDVSLEGNTLVNVSKTKDSTALPLDEELTYLYANTQYTVQFISDKVITADITLGGTSLLAQSIVAGLNRIAITTPATLVDNKLIISGVGANISEVVVTDTDREFGYFEGMKSVGECEELEVKSGNKNLYNLTENDWIDYGYFNPDGSIKQWGGYHYTATYIDVSALKGKRVYMHLEDGEYTKVVAYDTNKKQIAFFATGGASDIVAGLPINTNFIRLSTGGTAYRQNTNMICKEGDRTYSPHQSNTQQLTHEPLRAVGNAKDRYVLIDGNWYIEKKCGIRAYQEGDEDNYKTDLINTVYPLEMPTYEEIDYNPLEVYSGTTNITTNSVIPTNITVKNHGYNCLLKPSTTYTISSNLGLNTVTTPSILTEDCLRFMDTDTSDVTTMRDVLVLEGDWTTKADLIPANFSGIESAFEQEYDAEKGKYKVNVKVANEDKSKENNITFYINEPLRGVGDVKDRVYVKDDKVVVERNCSNVTLDGSDDEDWKNMSTSNSSFRFVINSPLDMKHPLFDAGIPTIINNTLNSITGADSWNNIDGIASHSSGVFCIYKKLINNKETLKQWLQQNPVTVVYQLVEPVYEEVEYNNTKLFIESFKNSTLFYNSNVPVTSTLHYSYSVPIVDTVAQTANVTDQQDSMIIDLATQVAVMEMMLM